MLSRLRVLLFVVVLTSPFLVGQRTNGDEDDAPEISVINDRWEDYRVGVGDTLEIEVVDVLDLSQTLQVSASGKIDLHPVGDIPVEGLTAIELEGRIGSVLQNRGLVKDPEVLVFVQDYRAKRVYVLGEFANPGEFVMSRNISAMDAILLAGGLTAIAADDAYLHRGNSNGTAPPPDLLEQPDSPRDGVDIKKIDLRPLAEGRVPEPDLLLQEGDYLVVGRRNIEYFFVLGEVIFPLNYMIRPDQEVTATKAISRAGGPTRTAKLSEGVLIREDSQGVRHELRVDFNQIIQGKEPDLEVRANDIIFIPGSILREFGEAFIIQSTDMIRGATFRLGRRAQLPGPPDGTTPQFIP